MSPAVRSAERRVLLVEDEPNLREVEADLLRDLGFAVSEASNGLEALRLLRTAARGGSPPDLIILDLMMPVMDGWQFRLEQKRDPAISTVPVLVVSGDDTPQAAAIDADLVLMKPFGGVELQAALDEVLRAADGKRESARALERDRLASLGLLAAGISHEINNPLTYVVMNLEQLAIDVAELGQELGPTRAASMTEAIEEAREGAGRVQRIVGTLSALTRRAGDPSEPADVHVALALGEEIAKNEIRHRGRLVRRLGQVPRVVGGEARLAQVFANLLLHAAKALPETGTSENEIALSTRVGQDGLVVVEIEDNGQGLARSAVPHVFEAFFSSPPVVEGSGLGLYVAHQIVTSLGGRIEVESAPARGTTFRVRLRPVEGERKAPGAAAAEGRPGADVSRPRARAKILVIDDERFILTTVRRMLSAEHDVEIESSPLNAYRRLSSGEPFDLVLCDMMMPELSGMELYERLERERPAIVQRFVFLSGGTFTAHAMAFSARIPNVRIDKPFQPEDLRSIVRGRLAEAASATQAAG